MDLRAADHGGNVRNGVSKATYRPPRQWGLSDIGFTPGWGAARGAHTNVSGQLKAWGRCEQGCRCRVGA